MGRRASKRGRRSPAAPRAANLIVAQSVRLQQADRLRNTGVASLGFTAGLAKVDDLAARIIALHRTYSSWSAASLRRHHFAGAGARSPSRYGAYMGPYMCGGETALAAHLPARLRGIGTSDPD